MRPLFAVAAGLLCALYGFTSAANLQQRAASLRRWADMTSHLSLLLEEAALPLPQVLRLAASASTGQDRLLQAVAQAMLDDPLVTAAEAFSARCPACTEKETLARMFMRIGHGDAQSRAIAAGQASRELASLANQAAMRADKDVKLYRTLGWTGGTCLTLLLL